MLYEITWDWEYDYYIIGEDLSVYSYEREVLLNDGTTYKIDKISEKKDQNEKYYFIQIRIVG